MSKRSQHCGLLTFNLLLSQMAGYGLILTGQWLYLIALILGGAACAGSLVLCLDNNPPETRVENHYYLYYDAEKPQRTPSRW